MDPKISEHESKSKIQASFFKLFQTSPNNFGQDQNISWVKKQNLVMKSNFCFILTILFWNA